MPRLEAVQRIIIVGLLLWKEHYYNYIANAAAINKTRVLYIITSGHEFHQMQQKRGMEHHEKDRLFGLVIPIVLENLRSIQSNNSNFQVDVYLILGYNLSPAREERLRHELLPLQGQQELEIWQDATPLDYDDWDPLLPLSEKKHLRPINRALARQHRHVIRDKLDHYDLFATFEDDMVLTKHHLEHYLYWKRKIFSLRSVPPSIKKESISFEPLSSSQWDRLYPGFIRVEVLRNDYSHRISQGVVQDGVPPDFSSSDGRSNLTIDASLCCHIQNSTWESVPQHPSSSDIVLWETGIGGMGVRELVGNDSWVGLLLGGGADLDQFLANETFHVKHQPKGYNDPRFVAQSAGWILEQHDVLDLELRLCNSSLLPPFGNSTSIEHDYKGQEYWMGGLQMWGLSEKEGGCGIQRIVSLDGKNFSKHLLYHLSNNKQVTVRPQERLVRANDLLGQLNTIRKQAVQRNRNQKRRSFT